MNKNSNMYAVVFTVVLSSVCAVMLAFAREQWAERIEANQNFARIRAVVIALGLADLDAERAEIVEAYQGGVTRRTRGDMEFYEGHRRGDGGSWDGDLAGYAMEIEGRGKYGPIKGILAIGPNSQSIQALRIYEQNETPGLGGLITSEEWLGNFAGVPLVTNGQTGVYFTDAPDAPNEVPKITGASLTSRSLQLILNTSIAMFLSGGRRLEPLDLGLGPDSVTRATPGYPKNMDLPDNVRETVQRPDFMAPPGIVNVARGCEVTSSLEMEPIIGELSQVTDGVKMSGEFDYVELDPGPNWVQVDLGEERTVYCIVVWHYYKNAIVYRDVIVQISNDPDFEEGVTTLFNNDIDNSAGQGTGEDDHYWVGWWGELIDTRGPTKDGTRARYIRVYTDGGFGGEATRFIEIAAYGEPEND